jgi:hypothetical protein
LNGRGSAERRAAIAALALLAASLSACAPRTTRVALPDGDGVPLAAADARAIADAVTARCAADEALTADVRVGGQVDGERIRGTLQLGVDADGLRIEGVPPFGAPLFVLAGRTDAATLLFPRDNAYVPGAPVAALTEALIGVAIGPADLRMLLSGCGVSVSDVRAGARFGEWTRLDTGDGARVWLTTGGPDVAAAGAPIVRVAETASWRLDYARREGDAPLRGTLVALRAPDRTRLSFEVVAPERLPSLPPAALEVVVPEGARPVSLDDLRRRRVLADS